MTAFKQSAILLIFCSVALLSVHAQSGSSDSRPKVDANTATVDEMVRALPDMTKELAEQIVAHRPYSDFRDLRRSTIREELLEGWRNQFTFSHAGGTPPPSAGTAEATNRTIISFKERKVAEKEILDFIETTPKVNFDLSANGLAELRKAKVSHTVIAAMQARARSGAQR
jgi:hypothetical protein